MTQKAEIQKRIDWRYKYIESLLTEIIKLQEELDEVEAPVVQVVYLAHTTGNGWLDTPLQTRQPYDYVDGTLEGLRVGDVVVAPTAYGDRMAIVVQVGGPRTYWGTLKKITEVLYP